MAKVYTLTYSLIHEHLFHKLYHFISNIHHVRHYGGEVAQKSNLAFHNNKPFNNEKRRGLTLYFLYATIICHERSEQMFVILTLGKHTIIFSILLIFVIIKQTIQTKYVFMYIHVLLYIQNIFNIRDFHIGQCIVHYTL